MAESTSTELSPGPILALSGAYWKSSAVHAGVRLDLFTPLAKGPATAQALAPQLSCDARALGMLMNALCALGLLVKQGEAYSLTEASAAFLVASSPSACLLYTSPSPRDRQKSRMPSSA